MGSRHCVLVALICVPNVAAQAEDPALDADLSHLTLDEVIERLPPAGNDRTDTEGPWSLTPVAAEMRTRVERGDPLTGEQWTRALLTTGSMKFRSRWPVTDPFVVALRKPSWLPLTRVSFDPRPEGLAPIAMGTEYIQTCGIGMRGESAEHVEEVGLLPLGSNRLVFDVTFERGPKAMLFADLPRLAEQMARPPHPPAGVFFRGQVAIDVEVLPTAGEVIPPTTSGELDEAVRRALYLARTEDGLETYLVLAPDGLCEPSLLGVALALHVEVAHGDGVEEIAALRPILAELAPPDPGDERSIGSLSSCELISIPSALVDSPRPSAWSVRIRGTSERVCELLAAERYWAGEIVLSVEELVRRGQEARTKER